MAMRAVAGDELLVRGRHVGDEDREGVIVEVRGEDGAAPYLVRSKDGHESVSLYLEVPLDLPALRGLPARAGELLNSAAGGPCRPDGPDADTIPQFPRHAPA